MPVPPKTEPVPASGVHTCGAYVSILGRLVHQHASGTLTVSVGPDHRSLYLVAGSPVWFESSRPADQLSPEELDDVEARLRLVKRGIAGPLQWRLGSWTWDASDGLPAEILMRSVFLDCSALAPLWAGVRQSMRQDDVLGAVTARGAGLVTPEDGLAQGFASLEVEGPLRSLLDHLPGPVAIEDLLREFAVEHQDLFKLLWTLELLGHLRREGERAQPLGLAEPPPPETPQLGSSGDAPPPFVPEVVDEPETGEFALTPSGGIGIPSQQVIEAIRRGTVPDGPSALLAPRDTDSIELESLEVEQVTHTSGDLDADEWSDHGEQAALTPTLPSAEPTHILPELPRYRPSVQPERAGRYVQTGSQPAVNLGEGEGRQVRDLTNPAAERIEVLNSATHSIADVSPGVGPAGHFTNPNATTAQRLADAVKRDYRTRMGTDYYTFLGVPAKAAQPLIDRGWNKLMKRWTTASRHPEIPEETRALAKELGQVGHLARRTFSVPERRAEYDRRLARGQAPLAGKVRAARTRNLPKTNPGSIPPTPAGGSVEHITARQQLSNGNYAQAVLLLRALRGERPSDPDVLSDLGWAVWKGSAETDREGAEEYLQLAVTFDPRHVRAREFLARVALDAGDTDAARSRLERLLKLQPDSRWARTAFAGLPETEDGASPRRLAFWKK